MKNFTTPCALILALCFAFIQCGGGGTPTDGEGLTETISEAPPLTTMVGDWALTTTVTEGNCEYYNVDVGETNDYHFVINTDGTCNNANDDGVYMFGTETDITSECNADDTSMVYFFRTDSYYYENGDETQPIDCTVTKEAIYSAQFADGTWSGTYSYTVDFDGACVSEEFNSPCAATGTVAIVPVADTVKIVSFVAQDEPFYTSDFYTKISFEVEDPYAYTYPVLLSEDDAYSDFYTGEGSYYESLTIRPEETTTYTLELRRDNDDGSYDVIAAESVAVTVINDKGTDTTTSTATTTSTSTQTTTSTATSTSTSTTATSTSTSTATNTSDDQIAALTISDFEIINARTVVMDEALTVQITVTNTGDVVDFVPKLTLTERTGAGAGVGTGITKPTIVVTPFYAANATTITSDNFTLAAGETATFDLLFSMTQSLGVEPGKYTARLSFVRDDNDEAVAVMRDEGVKLFGFINVGD